MRRLLFRDVASRCASRHSLLAVILVLAASVGGNLGFSDTTTLSLVFNGFGSQVNWTDPFWSTDKTGTDGWLIYQTAGTTTGLGNLVVSGTTWLDSAGNSFLDVLPGASFGVQQVGSDVYLTLVATVPEPATCVMALAGLACGGHSIWRRRKRA